MGKTKIEWVRNQDGSQGRTWNVIHGCTKVSPGCAHCYAERMARRLAGKVGYPEAPHHFDVVLRPDRLSIPLRRRVPTMYFVPSMGDLFHPSVPDEFVRDVFYTMYQCPQHTFQLLTKRSDRMLDWFNRPAAQDSKWHKPLPNVWLGVSVENSDYLWRVEELMKCPAVARFVSAEPLLGAIDNLKHYLGGMPEPYGGGHCGYVTLDMALDAEDPSLEGADLGWEEPEWQQTVPPLDWVIVGGESGPGARPMHPDWARNIRDQCVAVGVPFFFKQWGAWKPIGDFDPQTGVYHYAWKHAAPYKQVASVGLDGGVYNNDYPPRKGWHMARVGKGVAGRLLDGREHNEMPTLQGRSP